MDGETNLKHKQADKSILRMAPTEEACCRIFNKAAVECEGPNEFLYKFEGTFKMSADESIPCNADQLLLRGSSLRNTEWAIGVAVYTGHESKIMKNSPSARTKRSMIETRTNRYIVYTVLFQVVVCIVGATYAAVWEANMGSRHWYLDDSADPKPLWRQILFTFGVWLVAELNLVPISLLVTLELVKFFQAYFISQDWLVFDETKDMEARVQSSNLNEQLGMVHYIFSDKTGTLTQNIMEFKRFSAGPISYGTDNPKKLEYAPGVTNVNFEDSQFDAHIRAPAHSNHPKLKEFVEALGVCHTVITEEKVTKDGKPYVAYNASSPDELALVNGARHLGFGFRERDEEGNMVIDSWEGVRKYKLLNLIEFDSDRKRMSVIVRTPDNKLMLICKGADSIIEKRLIPGQPLLHTTN